MNSKPTHHGKSVWFAHYQKHVVSKIIAQDIWQAVSCLISTKAEGYYNVASKSGVIYYNLTDEFELDNDGDGG